MRTRHVIEAAREGLRVESQSLFRTKERKWPAAEIDRIFCRCADGQRGGKGRSCTRTVRRLMLLLKDGKRRPLLGDRGNQSLDWVCQTLTAGLQQAGVNAAWPSFTPRASSPIFRGPPRVLGVVFLVFSSVFFIAGWSLAITQDLRLRHAVPVQATVLSVEASHRFRDRRPFTVCRYCYSVNGHSYESGNLFAISMSGPVEDELRERFLANVWKGQSLPAWYEPGDPTTVFVVRERLFGPYLFFVFLSMVFIVVSLSIALQPQRRKIVSSGAPPLDLVRRRGISLFWTLAGAAAIGHYLMRWPTTWRVDFLVTAITWLIVSLVPAALVADGR